MIQEQLNRFGQWIAYPYNRSCQCALSLRLDIDDEVKRRLCFPWMIQLIGQQGQHVEIRNLLVTLLNRWVEIDVVDAWPASRANLNLHITICVEAAGIANRTVVVEYAVAVVIGIRAAALQVNRENLPCLYNLRCRHETRIDLIRRCTDDSSRRIDRLYGVRRPAHINGHGNLNGKRARATRGHMSQHRLRRMVASCCYMIPNRIRPFKRQ